jgi:phage terminase small subunit
MRIFGITEFVIEQLKQDYKQVPASWRISLDLIADDLDLYFALKDQLKVSGLYSTDGRGQTCKNPLLPQLDRVQGNIIHLISAFGATPMSKTKLKQTANTNIQEILDNLIE